MAANPWFISIAAIVTLLSIESMIKSTHEQKFYLLVYQLFAVAMLFSFLALDDIANHYNWLFGLWMINLIILLINIKRLS